MRVPFRKPGKYALQKPDNYITRAKFDELTKKLAKLKSNHPAMAREVSRLAELGDFSENMEYQLAKGRLQGILNGITKTERQLNDAIIIHPQEKSEAVELGSTVTIEIENANQTQTFQILGSEETDPKKGVISHHSPLGAALIGKKINDIIAVNLSGREVKYKILKIK